MSMSDVPGADLFEAIDPRFSAAMSEGRFHDALVLAFSAYLAFQQENDPRHLYAQAALAWIEQAVIEIHRVSGISPRAPAEEPQCSFCGQKPPEVRLVAGPGVFICNSCVATVGEALNGGADGAPAKPAE
ncbi:MAG: ClpX C4-type zinc finger protein [Stellaceae bacterium]